MPGQPAWTLTEMLECNLPLCWAGGGDCKVGPALICWRPICFLFLSPLGLLAADLFIKKFEEAEKQARGSIFFLEQKRGHAGRFFWSRKQGMLGDFSGVENRACWAFSPWSRKSAATIFWLQQNSQICMQIG